MSTGTMLFNPFTGKPRDPRDVASDPQGLLLWDGEEPVVSAAGPRRNGTAADLHALFKAAPASQTSASRTRHRREVEAAVRRALEGCITDIRERIRLTPAWRHGYESAITAIELRLEATAPKGER